MKMLCCVALLLAGPLASCGAPDDDEKAAQELNVNSRYTIESIHVSGQHTVNIGNLLQSELDKVIGSKYDDSTVKNLAERIKRELHVTDVAVNVVRGTEPDHVIVNFEVSGSYEQTFDLTVRKFLYDSKEGFNGDGSATMHLQGNAFTFGLISDNDSLMERFAGMRAKFERKKPGHQAACNSVSSSTVITNSGMPRRWRSRPQTRLYRSRQEFTPEATLDPRAAARVELRRQLRALRGTLIIAITVGGAAAAKTESSNAVVNTLRYHQRWGSEHDQKRTGIDGLLFGSRRRRTCSTPTTCSRGMWPMRAIASGVARQDVEVGFLAG